MLPKRLIAIHPVAAFTGQRGDWAKPAKNNQLKSTRQKHYTF